MNCIYLKFLMSTAWRRVFYIFQIHSKKYRQFIIDVYPTWAAKISEILTLLDTDQHQFILQSQSQFDVHHSQ